MGDARWAGAETNPLVGLLGRSVVRVETGDGGFLGSGFFVAPGAVVTCGHVVHAEQHVRVVWEGAVSGDVAVAEVAADQVVTVPDRGTVSDPEAYPLPDVALLRVDVGAAPGFVGHPCVRLSTSVPPVGVDAAQLYAAAYSREHDRSVPGLTGAALELEALHVERGGTLLKLRSATVPDGVSGAPLLDLAGGDVVGMVESSRDVRAPHGGFAVPVAAIMEALPDLLEANAAAHRPGAEGGGVWARAVEDVATAAAVRAGRQAALSLSEPRAEWVGRLDGSVAEMLKPKYGLVPYVGRDGLRAGLRDWYMSADLNGSPVEVWFVTGAGGYGKTRLGMEVCAEAATHGWTTGLLGRTVVRADDGRLGELARWPGRLLVVVDYAEARPSALAGLVQQARKRSGGGPMRVIALVRRRMSRPQLIDHFTAPQAGDPPTEGTPTVDVEPSDADLPALQMLVDEITEAPGAEVGVEAVINKAEFSRLDAADVAVDRLELFRVARDRLAQPDLLDKPAEDPSGPVPSLRADHFARPLYVLAAAALAAADDTVDIDQLSEHDLLLRILEHHETRHWARMHKKGADAGDWAPTLNRKDQWVAVALATLLGARDLDEAKTIARLVPHIGDDEQVHTGLARWLATLYPIPGANYDAVSPLEPDRLGEVLVTDVLTEDANLLGEALKAASSSQRNRLLTVAAATASTSAVVNGQLRDLLNGSFAELLEDARSGDQPLFTALMNAFAIAQPVQGALAATERFSETIPLDFASAAAAITRVAVDGLSSATNTGVENRANLARSLTNLNGPLVQAGLWERALETAQEAVEICRGLVGEPGGDGHLINFAGALANLGASLTDAGLWERALETAQEAVEIYRGLVGEPGGDAHLINFAGALTVLGASFSNVGRTKDALAVDKEVVGIVRDLLRRPDGNIHQPKLAGALRNLAITLSEERRYEQAAKTAQEAVEIYRDLVAHTDGDGYLPDLGRTLGHLSNSYSAMGRHAEALATAQEAVEICRCMLGRTDGDRYLPNMAAALSCLARILSKAGRDYEALEADQQAVDYYRHLAKVSPAAFRPLLASSLTDLNASLAAMRHFDQGLRAVQEAVQIYRNLVVGTDGDKYISALALALSNLGASLQETKTHYNALVVSQEALNHYRTLVTRADDGRYLPDLARTLTGLADILSSLGRDDEAMQAAQEAVDTYHDLVGRADGNNYLVNLAGALASLADSLSQLERDDEAVQAAQEAVDTYHDLVAQTDDGSYRPDLARTLTDLADILSKLGRDDEAMQAAQEAVDTYHDLVGRADGNNYLVNLARALNSLAKSLSDAGRDDDAINSTQEAVEIYRNLMEVDPGAYTSDFHASLHNLVTVMSKAGRSNWQIEDLFSSLLAQLDHIPLANGYIRLFRGNRRHTVGYANGIPDLIAAINAFTSAEHARGRGWARMILREARKADSTHFDVEWNAEHNPLPLWLTHLDIDPAVTESLIRWVQHAPDWPVSESYLAEHATVLLTDQGEASLEHCIDIMPSAATSLTRHLILLQEARRNGIEHAYSLHSYKQNLQQQMDIISAWISTSTWVESETFASRFRDQLITPTARAALNAAGEQDLKDLNLRIYRGLIELLASASPDEIYQLLHDSAGCKQMLETAEADGDHRRALALARIASGSDPGNPEGHYQLLIAALHTGHDAEALTATLDCKAHIHHYEANDYAQRLTALGTQHPHLSHLTNHIATLLRPNQQPEPHI